MTQRIYYKILGFLPVVSVEPGLIGRKSFDEELLLGEGECNNTTIHHLPVISSTTADQQPVPTFTITPLGRYNS
jgi:hypothetical protein